MYTDLLPDEELVTLAQQVDPLARSINKSLSNTFLRAFRDAMGNVSSSLKKEEFNRIRKALESRLSKYAKWIRVDLMSSCEGVKFHTNFNTVIKTEKGMLYGHSPGKLRKLFYTTHCLERFTQRVEARQYKSISSEYLSVYSRRPTPSEVLDEILLWRMPYLEFGLVPSTEIYVNTILGILVLDSFSDCYVAKTFLPINSYTSATWYCVRDTDWEIDGIEPAIKNRDIKGVLHHYAEPCRPHFMYHIPRR